MRITCPSSVLSLNQRVDEASGSLNRWINSDALDRLVNLFGGHLPAPRDEAHLGENLEYLHRFVDRWNYRQGKERWTVDDEDFVSEHKEIIMDCSDALGLRFVTEPLQEPDYILPLGGARRANLSRPLMARKVIDSYGWTGKKVVALSGTRPINEVERPFMGDFAPDAPTEFDAISKGLERSFGVLKCTERRTGNDNPNLCSAVRRYDSDYRGCEIYSLAAPSSDPENRRANSFDTFEYLLEQFNIQKGDKLLLVTSCIYVPFQTLKFLRLAIERGFEVDCIGSDTVEDVAVSKTSNFLQEIKGTVDAIYDLTHELAGMRSA